MQLGLGSENSWIAKKATYDNEGGTSAQRSMLFRVQTRDPAPKPWAERDSWNLPPPSTWTSKAFRRLGRREAQCGKSTPAGVCRWDCKVCLAKQGGIEKYPSQLPRPALLQANSGRRRRRVMTGRESVVWYESVEAGRHYHTSGVGWDGKGTCLMPGW